MPNQVAEVSKEVLEHSPEFQLYLPFAKVDEEQREVWGYATVDEVDSQGEVVDFDASIEAFTKWAGPPNATPGESGLGGNVREMHQPIAVGRLIAWAPDIERRAIWVGVRISKGAQATWEKVRDGTLRGFSVGGRKLQIRVEPLKDLGRTVARVVKYTLSELSVVDAPSCPSCAFVLVKSADGQLVGTEVLEVPNEDMQKAMSFESLRDKIQGILNPPGETGVSGKYVTETHEDHVIVRDWTADTYFRYPYTANLETEEVTLGEPVEVEVTYLPKGEKSTEESAATSTTEGGEMAKADDAGTASVEYIHGVRDACCGMVLRMCGCEDCLKMLADLGIENAGGESQAGEEVKKAAHSGDLAKIVGMVDQRLAKALGAVTQDLAKAQDVQSIRQELIKAAGTIAELGDRVKRIEDQPVPGGPALRGAQPMEKSFAGLQSGQPLPSDQAVLEKMLAETNDPMLKDAIGRKLAVSSHPAVNRSGQ